MTDPLRGMDRLLDVHDLDLSIDRLEHRREVLEVGSDARTYLDSANGHEAQGATLLVTVDCGTTSHEPLAEARKLGLDVILYGPEVHFDQVKNKAFGTQTSDWR